MAFFKNDWFVVFLSKIKEKWEENETKILKEMHLIVVEYENAGYVNLLHTKHEKKI